MSPLRSPATEGHEHGGRPISATTRLAAVIGSPVRHSLSPALHNTAFRTGGLDWRFLAFEVAPGDGAGAVAAMKTLGIGGLAVTMPHKGDVAAAVDELDPDATRLRSVNTVVLRDDGTTFGTSTDGAGLVASVRAAGVEVTGSRVVLIGGGAAARSIAAALASAEIDELIVVNRTRSKAEEVAALAGGRVGSVADIADASLLINATSIGMGVPATDEADTPVDRPLLHPALAVADIVYHPLETRLLREARDVGATAIDGLGMLVHQAALQQELWTGVAPDVAAMRAAAAAELAAR